ncbi:MAG: MerR family transcriptional regulator [Acidimicrobiales bacterium]
MESSNLCLIEYRVAELAAAAGVSVDALRSYQSKKLLPPPQHHGRVALYGPRHLDRLRTILDLKQRGHSLRAIRSMVAEPSDGAGGRPQRTRVAPDTTEITVAELAERARVPLALVRSLEESGVLQPLKVGAERRYTTADLQAVRMLASLVGGGVPMAEFLDVAQTQIEAATAVAERALSLFLTYVRLPLLERRLPPTEEADRLMHAFRIMLQAATGLIVYNIQRTMLNRVEEEMERVGTDAERNALRREVARRRFEIVLAT